MSTPHESTASSVYTPTNPDNEPKVTLISEDGEKFSWPLARLSVFGAFQSLSRNPPPTSIPIPEVKSETLSKILEYLRYHAADPLVMMWMSGEEVEGMPHAMGPLSSEGADDAARTGYDGPTKYSAFVNDWDAEFVNVDLATLIELVKGANFLYIPPLIDLICKAIANQMVGLSPEQLREKFHIENDLTKEEEERIHRESAWIDEN